jgi:chemotaxis signal transduction protein
MINATPQLVSGEDLTSGRGVDHSKTIVAFRVSGLCFGLPVEAVRRVISAFQISPLPGDAPAIVGGVIQAEGALMPVIDPHRLMTRGVPAAITPQSRFIIAQTPTRLVAFVADAVDGVKQIPADAFRCMEQLSSDVMLLREVGTLGSDLVYIYDPDNLLAREDEAALSAAIGGLLP